MPRFHLPQNFYNKLARECRAQKFSRRDLALVRMANQALAAEIPPQLPTTYKGLQTVVLGHALLQKAKYRHLFEECVTICCEGYHPTCKKLSPTFKLLICKKKLNKRMTRVWEMLYTRTHPIFEAKRELERIRLVDEDYTRREKTKFKTLLKRPLVTVRKIELSKIAFLWPEAGEFIDVGWKRKNYLNHLCTVPAQVFDIIHKTEIAAKNITDEISDNCTTE